MQGTVSFSLHLRLQRTHVEWEVMSARHSKKKSTSSSPRTPSSDELVIVGVIAQPHGIHGEVRVHQYNPDSEVLWEVDAIQVRRKGQRTMETMMIEDTRYHTKGPLLTLKNCNSRNEADLLRGAEIFLHTEDMPELDDMEFYFHQVEGFPVFNTHTGEAMGEVVRVIPSPAQDLMVVLYEKREVLIPVVEELIPVIDLEAKRVEVNPIPGLFEKES